MSTYEHKHGFGRVFPNTKPKSDKAPHFSGTCNPEGTQRQIAMWIELNNGVDPAVLTKIMGVIKHIGVKIEDVYQKQGSAEKESSDAGW